MNRGKVILASGALVLVPVLFGSYVALSYRVALGAGRLPITNEPEWIRWIVLISLLACGVYLLSLATKGKLRIILGVLYVGGMTVALFSLHLWIACAYGDCL